MQDENTYLFLTKEGVAVLSKDGIPQTAYTSAQFKDHIIRCNNTGLWKLEEE